MVLAIRYLGPSIMSFPLRKASASCAVGRKKGAFGLGSIVLSSIFSFSSTPGEDKPAEPQTLNSRGHLLAASSCHPS